MHRWRYRPTNAEYIARREGLHHDSRGYYRVANGRRVYVTGHDSAGRRFHVVGGRRVWDDPVHWPSYYANKRHALEKRRNELKSRIESLRGQYQRARGHDHVLARNIVRRLHATERQLDRVTAEIRSLPSNKPFFLSFKNSDKFRFGVSVSLDAAQSNGTNYKDPPWGTSERVGPNQLIWIRATVTLQDPEWRPGRVASPDMLRLLWHRPNGWISTDQVDGNTMHEYIVSNPLYVVRAFRSPTTGDTTPTFRVEADLYEFSFVAGHDSVPIEGSL